MLCCIFFCLRPFGSYFWNVSINVCDWTRAETSTRNKWELHKRHQGAQFAAETHCWCGNVGLKWGYRGRTGSKAKALLYRWPTEAAVKQNRKAKITRRKQYIIIQEINFHKCTNTQNINWKKYISTFVLKYIKKSYYPTFKSLAKYVINLSQKVSHQTLLCFCYLLNSTN